MLLFLATMTLAASAVMAVHLVLGLRSLPRLDATPPLDGAGRVSIIVPARDERRHVAAAVTSMLAQDHGDVEVIAVDDRSSDGTAELLDGMAARSARMRVLHVAELPPGWLGKNHALQLGAEAATGDLILFTDADVVMRPDTLRRALAVMRATGADHLSVAPRLHSGSPWATMTMAVFLSVFSAVFRPWKAKDPESRHHMGVGAFNLVLADAYRSIGGHRSLALRPDDDLRLGRALKEAGFAQAAALGRRTISVEWYPSLRAMARGLRKNAFAVVDYRVLPLAAATLLPVAFTFWPVAALFVTVGAVWWANVAIVALGALGVWATARSFDLPAWTALLYPLASVFLVWIVWASALRAVRTGTIEWRGTEYPLDELRRGS